ncbi:hypothetical protein E4T52_11740 [Aureobasidium sp. EXF-3400]|nr:hypothetical protein E4T51_10805 [Aureobasidium sp. EXF-12344]KAI4773282.1 hypothetical protein E4T52_11740 [Aureobasidium sp. EXF-3400]
MKSVYSTLGFALGASAATLVARDQCCFSLTAAGGKTGAVGQLSDGQNRIGQTSGLATGSATYCINNGGLTDENGRGCILTSPTTQFQCDVGASPTTGFAVNSNGDLTYNGSTQFYACATGDNGGYNIYTTTTSAETGCVAITLSSGGKCAGSNGSGSSSAASSKPASSSVASSKPASSAPASSAPASSKPASSAPASSAPASSKPASSAPASSKPASSAPSAPASSAPASSKPASSAPASSAPASSKPASSAPVAPASSAPASSKPASSAPVAPAPSAPASSAPAGNTVTVYSTSYVTVTNCAAGCTPVASAPASSKPASSAPVAPASSAPASSKPASSAPVAPASSGPASSKPASSAPVAPASSAPASSKPASSAPVAPASSAPASSKPASSAPVAPASSAPVSSKPASSAPASSAPASSKPASSAPASGTSGNVCATTLTGAYQTPHAIIPVNKNSPSTSYGTQYDAYISSSNSTIFNFDIPSSYAGKQCTVIFLLPNKSQLATSNFTLSGAGGITFDQLTSPAPLSVTYATSPAVKTTLDTISSVTSGNSYVVSSGACQAGSTISILASATGSLDLELFEDWNPSALGLFITSC